MHNNPQIQSLRRIFSLFLASLSIIALSGLGYISKDTKRDLRTDLIYITEVIQGYYHLSFHQWELSLLSVGNRMIEIEDAAERLAYANKALEVYEDELLAFGLADTSGQVQTFTGKLLNDSLPNLKKSELTRRSFETALKDPNISLGECYYFENVKDWILPIRVPIRDSLGNVLAINTSAIDYSSMIDELRRFSISEEYQVHLANNQFNTTQLYFPLDSTFYDSVLGSDSLVYTEIDTISQDGKIYILNGVNPLSKEKSIIVCTEVESVNHRLMISVPRKVLWARVLDRFTPVIIIYLILIASLVYLYRYLRGNLEKSIRSLVQERANLKAIIESTESIIALFDPSKRLIAFNQAFFDSAKLTDNIELKEGMTIEEVVPSEEYRELFSRNMDKALAGEKYYATVDYPGPEGTITFRFTYNPVRNEGKVVGLSLFAENITEIRQYQQQLEDYNRRLEETVSERTTELKKKNQELEQGYEKLKSTQQQLIRAEKMASLGILSAGIGHEINNPLNFIKHGSVALKMKLDELKLKDSSAFDAYFHAIDEGVRRAANIVSSLSGYSRSSGNMSEKCDVHKIVKNSLMMLSSRFRDKSINIETEFYAQEAVVRGNSGKLHQVFTNFIANAEQAISGEGFIKLVTKNEGDLLILTIQDSGSGMSEEVLSKIMDPFFTTKGQGEGTGLGLFISQMIIDEHDGHIEVASEVGAGTTFTIQLKVFKSDLSQ